MSHPSRTTRALSAACVATTLLLTLGACGSSPSTDPEITIPEAEDSGPAVTAEPPEPDEPSTEEQDVQAAQDAYEEYLAALNALAQSGYDDPAPVSAMLWGDSDYRTAVIDGLLDSRERGIVQVGEQRIADLTVVEYVPGATGAGDERVELEVCIDSSDFDQVAPDGTSVIMDNGVDRQPGTVTMHHQEDDRWTVGTVEWHQGKTC